MSLKRSDSRSFRDLFLVLFLEGEETAWSSRELEASSWI